VIPVYSFIAVSPNILKLRVVAEAVVPVMGTSPMDRLLPLMAEKKAGKCTIRKMSFFIIDRVFQVLILVYFNTCSKIIPFFYFCS